MNNQRCQAVVFRCIDFRITQTAFANLLHGIGYPEGSYDLVSCAGSGRDLVTGDGYLGEQIALSQKLHGIAEIVIIYHDNCGAYAIDNPIHEKERQENDFQTTRIKLAERFPDLATRGFILTGTPTPTPELRIILA